MMDTTLYNTSPDQAYTGYPLDMFSPSSGDTGAALRGCW